MAKYQHLSVSTGVLQHIAIADLTAWLVLRLPQPAQVGAVAALVLGTWAAFTFVAAPGVQPGSYAPGSNLAAAADRLLLGHEAREGILPALVSTLNVLGGVAVGRVLAAGRAVPYRTALLGLGGLVAGAALAFAVPLNKHLWTPSFALVTTGLSALVLAVAYVLLDSRPRPEAARPLRVLGANAIAVYVATSLLFDALLEPIRPALVEPVRLLAGDTAAAVGYAAAALLFGWALGEWFYWRRIFITI